MSTAVAPALSVALWWLCSWSCSAAVLPKQGAASPSFVPLRRHVDAVPGTPEGDDDGAPRRVWPHWRDRGAGRRQASARMGDGAGVRISSRQMRALSSSLGLTGRAGSAGFGLRGGAGQAAAAPVEVSRLRDVYSTEYVGPIGIGTYAGAPQAELNVIFDTGSSDLWVASDLCQDFPCVGPRRRRYNHSLSTTFAAPGQALKFSTVYGSGELHGQLGLDDVRLGPLVSRGQHIGLIAEEHGQAFAMLPLDGIVGLGFPKLAADPELSLLQGFSKQGALKSPQFAFYLHRDPARGGGVLWGGVDPRLYHGDLHWFPVAEETYWTLNLVAFKVGSRTFNFEGHAGSNRTLRPQLIVDSGTTFFTAEGDIYDAIASQVWYAPCQKIGVFPPLVYTLRDVDGTLRDITVKAEEYMVGADAPSGRAWGTCLPGIVNMESGEDRPMMILGEVFMRHYFTVFSLNGPEAAAAGGRPAVGLARTNFGKEADEFFSEAEAARSGAAAA